MMAGLFALVIVPSGCQKSGEEARHELNELGIHWSQEVFLERVENSDAVIVDLFIIAGMNPNATTNYGWTPLMHSALAGHTGIAKTLLKAGANVNIRDGDGWTALMYASEAGYADVVEALTKNHAEVNLRSNEGDTALALAEHQGHARIAEMLRQSGALELDKSLRALAKLPQSKLVSIGLRRQVRISLKGWQC